jgi:hypothetical protein
LHAFDIEAVHKISLPQHNDEHSVAYWHHEKNNILTFFYESCFYLYGTRFWFAPPSVEPPFDTRSFIYRIC